jgi:hypothetical protein
LNKKARRAERRRKEKRKKIIIIASCVLFAAVATTLIVFLTTRQSDERVYSDGLQEVTLFKDGTFTARLAHDTHNGTYSEASEDGVTIVSFTSEGITVEGSIVNNTLKIPDLWNDGHGHGAELKLK